MEKSYMYESFYEVDEELTFEKLEKVAGKDNIFAGIAVRWDDISEFIEVKLNDNLWGILPLNEVTIENLKYKESHIPVQVKAILGNKICFYVDKVENGNIVLSRRRLQQFVVKSQLRIDATYYVQVKALYTSGIFVDVGCGVIGYIHCSEISISKYLNYSYNNITLGSVIPAKLVSISPRIKLSYRRTANIKIKEKADFLSAIALAKVPGHEGYFVYVSPNEAGIVDINDKIHYLYHGQTINAKVKSTKVLTDLTGDVKVYYRLTLM